MNFPIVLHSDDYIHWGVTVPDLPGCFTAGDSIQEAMINAAEAIEFHLDGLFEDNEWTIANVSVSTIDTLYKNPDYTGGTWAFVEIDTQKYQGKAEKINITLPGRLLARIDRFAESHHESRSGFLARIAQEALREQH
jgi:predicted RNase H-like HicB family nuclease